MQIFCAECKVTTLYEPGCALSRKARTIAFAKSPLSL